MSTTDDNDDLVRGPEVQLHSHVVKAKSSANTFLKKFQIINRAQQLLHAMDNNEHDRFCWYCHIAVSEVEQIRCRQCCRSFHKVCWLALRPAGTDVDMNGNGHEGLSNRHKLCVECLAVADEHTRSDNVFSRVGLEKLQRYFLYMVRFVEQKLAKEDAGPFSTSRPSEIDDEVVSPKALLCLKRDIADGKFKTYAEFLTDLRGLLHKSAVVHGLDNGYTRTAAFIVETCKQLCNYMDWCVECFERSLPRSGEGIIAGVVRALMEPCSQLHVIVCIKLQNRLWPAVVYRYYREFANVRFFGTLEFGRFPKSSIYLLNEDFEIDKLLQEYQNGHVSYMHALQQCRLHIGKLLLIPNCSVDFFPKNTPYDGRLVMSRKVTEEFTIAPNMRGAKRLRTSDSGAFVNVSGNNPIGEGSIVSKKQCVTSSSFLPQSAASPGKVAEEKLAFIRTTFATFSNSYMEPSTRLTAQNVIEKTVQLSKKPSHDQPANCSQAVSRPLSTGSSSREKLDQFCRSPLSQKQAESTGSPADIKDFFQFVTNGPHSAKEKSKSDLRSSENPTVLHMNYVKDSSEQCLGQKERGLTEHFPASVLFHSSSVSQNQLKETTKLSISVADREEENTSPLLTIDERSPSSSSSPMICSSPVVSVVVTKPQSFLTTNVFPTELKTATPAEIVSSLVSGKCSMASSSTKESQTDHSAASDEFSNNEDVNKQQICEFLTEISRELVRLSERHELQSDEIRQGFMSSHTSCSNKLLEIQKSMEEAYHTHCMQEQQALQMALSRFQELFSAYHATSQTLIQSAAFEAGRKQGMLENNKITNATKRAFWCCVCRKRAQLLCCGVTLYCSDMCQIDNFTAHQLHCRRLLPAGAVDDDQDIQTPFGVLSLCQTLPISNYRNSISYRPDDDDEAFVTRASRSRHLHENLSKQPQPHRGYFAEDLASPTSQHKLDNN